MSSATVRRAGYGMDSTISPTHLPSVAGRPASGRGSMIPAGVWCNTRHMGAGRPAAPPHPVQTAPTPTRTRNSRLSDIGKQNTHPVLLGRTDPKGVDAEPAIPQLFGVLLEMNCLAG